MNTLLDKILTEWAYRVHDGMPNPKNPLHIVQLRESMEYLQIPETVIDVFVNNLTEQKFYARSAPDKQVSVFQSKDSFEKHVKDKGYIPVPPEEAEKELEGGEETQEEPPQTEKTKIDALPFKGGGDVDTEEPKSTTEKITQNQSDIFNGQTGKGSETTALQEEIANISRKIAIEQPNLTDEEHREAIAQYIRDNHGHTKHGKKDLTKLI